MASGYIAEVTTIVTVNEPRCYSVDALCALSPAAPRATGNNVADWFEAYGNSVVGETGKSDDELMALLKASRATPGKGWREPMLSATGSMVGKGWSDLAIKLACAPYSDGGAEDIDIQKLIDTARKSFEKAESNFQTEQPEPKVSQASLIVSSADFIAGFVPPDYLIDGLLQKRFIYSLTAPTGSGKTAIALLWAAHVALGLAIGKYEVAEGRILYLAGENPDDIRMRMLAMAEHMVFDINKIDIHFLPGTFKLSKIAARIKAEVEKIGPVALVIVDTSAAYYEGDDENHNVQMGIHARRLRGLVTLPGEPCVVVCCHPVKNAAPDNMLPRGGGAYVAEMDGNLTCAKTDSMVSVHWQGKFRGPDFAPIPFALATVTTPTLRDSKGRTIPTVLAKPLTDIERSTAEATSFADEDRLLIAISEDARGHVSMVDLAKALGWLTKDGTPNKSRVQRCSDRLKKDRLIAAERGGLVLTAKGRKTVNRMLGTHPKPDEPEGQF